jgi:hypothetical protein
VSQHILMQVLSFIPLTALPAPTSGFQSTLPMVFVGLTVIAMHL